MTKKIIAALRDPQSDEGFMRWLTEDVYRGKRTAAVMERLGDLAKESVEPALAIVLEDDYLEKLKERFQRARGTTEKAKEEKSEPTTAEPEATVDVEPEPRRSPETTAEELEFFAVVQNICTAAGVTADEILHRDAVNYFNVSYRRPKNWFIRFFAGTRRKCVVTLVPTEEAKELVPGLEVEEAPSVFGVSRVYIDTPAQCWEIKALVIRSLELCQSGSKSQKTTE
jgi:hypothetical protein